MRTRTVTQELSNENLGVDLAFPHLRVCEGSQVICAHCIQKRDSSSFVTIELGTEVVFKTLWRWRGPGQRSTTRYDEQRTSLRGVQTSCKTRCMAPRHIDLSMHSLKCRSRSFRSRLFSSSLVRNETAIADSHWIIPFLDALPQPSVSLSSESMRQVAHNSGQS